MDNSSDLLRKLESSASLENMYTLISSYLLPFTQTESSKPRNLVKQFLPFLNRCLSLLPKRLLSHSPKLDSNSAFQLLEIYVLCLDCLHSVSSQLSGKAYAVHLQRVRLVHCYLFWERFGDAEREGIALLRSLCQIGCADNRNEYVPDVTTENDKDREFAWLLVEICVSLVKCVAMEQSKVESDYRRLLVMIAEITPWFRLLDANAHQKLHMVHVSYMSKCAWILVDDLNNFDNKLVRCFCLATFDELEKSSSKDQFYKFAHRLCYSLFSKQNNPSSVVHILACVLDSVASSCKVGTQITSTELLELVSYCATKSLYAGSNMSSFVAVQLQKFADDICLVSPSPTDLLTSLYATGLFISDYCGQIMAKGSTSTKTDKDSSIYEFLLYNEQRLQNLSGCLQSLKHYYKSTKRIHLHEDTDLVSYFSALKFLCKPLAEFVNYERKTIIAEIVDATSAARLNYIQDALHQFLEIFVLCQRGLETKIGASDGYSKITPTVAVAAFILSVRTKQGIKESPTFIMNAISSDWIQSHGLKFLFSSLYNAGVVLYKNNDTEEASISLELCCRASWTCLLNHCKLFVDKSYEFCDNLSEDSIIALLAEACTRSAFVLDVLYQCDCNKVNKLVTYTLEKWAAAEKLFDRLPSPTALLKQWVKIQCKISKVDDAENNGKTLYSVLPCSIKMSKRAPGILLEQELLLYEEMNPLNPTFCRRMRMEIIDILLKEVYVTKAIQRSRVLIAKGRELRARGVERLDDCIECLSESISMMSEINRSTCCDPVHSYYLANAYCLRALCTQEAEPDRKELSQKRFFEDMDAAIKLWMSIDLPLLSGQIDMVLENVLFLLYHVVDLLSLKGYMKFHANIYEIIIRLFEWRNVPVKKLLAILWECRRLGHALCASPVNETFITILSNHCDASNTMEYWLSCLTESPSLVVGFKQNFSYMFTDFSLGSHHHVSSQSEITIDGVQQAVSNLLSSVPLPSGSASIAAHMYYDLGERLISNGRFIEGCLSTSTSLGQETGNSVRHTPELLLREFVSNFYQSLPSAIIICISLLGVAYANLLRELSSSPASVEAWILFSRLKSDSQPVFLLLPADSILGGDDETTSLAFLLESKSSVKRWHCPWGSTVVDDVAPVFKLILEQNYLSSSTYPPEDTKTTRSLWWTQRRKLDQDLGHFLRDIEEKWFGPWKFLFCSDWSDCKHLDLATNKLADELKVKCDVDLHESLLRVILAGGQHARDSARCVPKLILNKGCHVHGVECNIDEMSMVFKLILETINDFEDICVNREPIILVLDHEIQMLPWESLPILRNQEVYRMPSVCSIFASLDRHDLKKFGTGSVVYPSIDPLDAYYLLNPSGGLISTEVEFDRWFKDQNLEGKTGITPTIEELTGALQSHELFIYFGHGSGAQYIPNHEIQKLRTCAATLFNFEWVLRPTWSSTVLPNSRVSCYCR